MRGGKADPAGDRERFLALSAADRRAVLDLLVEHALGRWNEHARRTGAMAYDESVVGTRQVVDARLPADALSAARSGQDAEVVAGRYGEPLAALQDGDLNLPDPVQYGYYAVYNYFLKYARGEPVDDWTIVNQAVSSEEDPRRQEAMLGRAVDEVAGRKR